MPRSALPQAIAARLKPRKNQVLAVGLLETYPGTNVMLIPAQ
jgi:hypothetical protein